MNFVNSATRYGWVSIVNHWATAALFIGLIGLGLVMDELPKGTIRLTVTDLHKSLGVLAFALVALRIAWNTVDRRPDALPAHAGWERMLARGVRLALWTGLIGLPLSGWILSAAGGHEVSFFGLFTLPAPVGENHGLHEAAEETHELLGNLLIAAVALHAVGALKHHFLDRDDTLARILPARSRPKSRTSSLQ